MLLLLLLLLLAATHAGLALALVAPGQRLQVLRVRSSLPLLFAVAAVVTAAAADGSCRRWPNQVGISAGIMLLPH